MIHAEGIGPNKGHTYCRGGLKFTSRNKKKSLSKRNAEENPWYQEGNFHWTPARQYIFWNQTFHHKSTEMGPYGCVKQEQFSA